MLPLGNGWMGNCHASPETLSPPDDHTLRTLCNLGYAREACRMFPQNDGPDAVRFTISADDGASLRLYYVVEQNHHPLQHGPLEYSRAAKAFMESSVSRTLLAQARAYVESYLLRKSVAPSSSLPATRCHSTPA
jgi:hypothetical protein